MLPTEHLLAFIVIARADRRARSERPVVVTRSLTLGPRAGSRRSSATRPASTSRSSLVAIGVGAIVQQSIAVFTIIKLAGAAYLVFLGVQAFRHRHSLVDALYVPVAAEAPAADARRRVPRRRRQPEGHRLLHRGAAAVRRPSAGAVSAQLLRSAPSSARSPLVCDGIWALPPARRATGSCARRGAWRRSAGPAASS